MSYSIEITEEAEWEIKVAKAWYNEQSEGLGDRFSETIKQHINLLKNPIKDHKPVYKNNRRVLVKGFPYVIYYQRVDESLLIKIIAVLHNKQAHTGNKSRIST